MTQRLRKAAWVVAILVSFGAVQEYFFLRPNRRALIGVMGDLRRGMNREDVTLILERHKAMRLRQKSDAEGTFLVGQTGLAQWWEMGVVFREGRLASARVWTEDGPYHPAGVPPDIPEGPDTSLESHPQNQ